MMYSKYIVILLAIGICSDSQAQFVLASGSSAASASGRNLTATVGQSFIDISGASGKNVGSGYWYTITQSLVSTDLETVDGVPGEFFLGNNYPNPFNPETRFTFVLPKQSATTLIVYDMLGSEVDRIIDQVLPAGEFRTSWTANGLASGTYFYQLESAGLVLTKKLVLMK